MLTEKHLGQILKHTIPPLVVSDIHWKCQDSDLKSILFYKITDDEKAKNIFIERINQSNFGWLVLNIDHPLRPKNSSVISEVDWPFIQKQILDILYPLPELKMIAITGTNGKTTTADLVLQLGELCGKKGISIGTLGVRENLKTLEDFGLTSPCLIDLRKFLNTYGKNKDFCVLEASSHALVQNRLFGLSFDMAGWLSFTQDHLDYHKNMDEYFHAKTLIIKYLKDKAKLFVPSSQNELFEKIKLVSDRVFKAEVIKQKLPLFFTTRFNRNNLEVAVAIVSSTFDLEIPDVYDRIIAPDGRFYIKPFKSNYIVVDFAHTPDALENICQGIRESFPAHKLTVLFGCGGDRDRTKRAIMGKIAQTWASKIYLTSDNPRNEDPSLIIDDIKQGISSNNVEIIVDRPTAVKRAFQNLGQNEVLLLAGKGHEDYILTKGVKYPYSDIGEVENFLRRKIND